MRYGEIIARARTQGRALTEHAAALEGIAGVGTERKATRAALHALASALETSTMEIAASGVGTGAPDAGEIAETVEALETLGRRSPLYAQASRSAG